MKISELITALQYEADAHGDIEVQLQSAPVDGRAVVRSQQFFVVGERYCDTVHDEPACPACEQRCSLRSWPY